jgi:hypothetical protein
MPGALAVSDNNNGGAREPARTLRPIWVAVFFEIGFGSLIRQRLAE